MRRKPEGQPGRWSRHGMVARYRTAALPLGLIVLFTSLMTTPAHAGGRMHFVSLGAVRKVPYTPPEATADSKSEEATTLKVRPLIVDDKQKEWTVGEMHEITDRSFVIRRALRLNDSLPGEVPRWTWQPGPWLLVDRTNGHVAAVHLPAFDPQVSEVAWFRDYAAYCGISTAAKGGLVAVVAELGGRKPVVQKTLTSWPQPEAPHPACAPAKWQRTPIRATLQATGGQAMTFDVVGTVSLVEEGEDGEP